MSTVKITMTYTYGGQECNNIFHFWNNAAYASNTVLADLAADFENDYVADFAACMVDGVVFDKLVLSAYDNPTILEYSLGAATGDIVVTDVDEIPVDLAANIRRSVIGSQDPVTGAPYTGNRPVRRGRFFLSGLPKTLMSKNGLNTASTAYAPFVTMLAQQQLSLTSSGAVAWQPVVFGLPLPELPPSPSFPGGKAARGHLLAVIDGASFVEFTKLDSRDE